MSLFSQNKDYFVYDDFIDNRNQWGDVNSDEFLQKIKDGVYVLKNRTSNSSYMFTNYFYINTMYNFNIEMDVKLNYREGNSIYSLVWGSKNWDNNYQFFISPDGRFCVGKTSNKEFSILVDWKTSTNLKPEGQYNHFGIEKRGDKLFFLINQAVVASTAFQPFFGNSYGIILDPAMSVSMDRFSIIHPKPPLRLVDGQNFKYKKKNLGPNINTDSKSEIAPIITPDGKTLYFARFTYDNLTNGSYGTKSDCDIWFSERTTDGTWGPAKKLPAPLNNDGDNLVIWVSADGNTLLLEGLYNTDGSYISDQGISISNRTSSGWSVPQKVVIEDFYNKNEYETFCFTTDRKVIVMAIERNDSYGGEDLYVSFRKSNGHYGKPIHLGIPLNTNLAEATPYLAPDNKTLYFCSQGHSGYGNMDIFVTKRLDETWLHWSEPQNIGPDVNDDKWNVYYSVSAQGNYAYMVCTGEDQIEDIYEIKLSESARPDPVVIIKGKVLDEETKKPIAATIVYEEGSNHVQAGEARSNPTTGEYSIVLPYGKTYRFQARANGHLSIRNEIIDLSKEASYVEIRKDLIMVPVQVGQIVQLHNVEFVRNKAELVKSSFSELDNLATLMLSNENMRIELSGHTETVGNPYHLKQLSEQRVNVVKDYLVKKGVQSTRITGKGYGGTKPIGKGNAVEENKNRRVEVKIIAM